MKPLEVKTKIKRIKEQMKLETILIKNYERDRDAKNFNERIAKQKDIVVEAEKAIAKIRHQRKTALAKIAKIKRDMRYEKKQLNVLNNFDKIELLKKVAVQLKTLRKETDDGEKHSNTQTSG